MRLDKFLSNLKYGSRTDVAKDIKKGLVKVNNEVITNSHYKINPSKDLVYFNDELVIFREIVNLMVNKPKGYLSANKDDLHEVVLSLLKHPYTKFDFKIAGRLDLDSEGLLILTTSGNLVNEITNPNKKVQKTYLINTLTDISNYQKLLEGVIIKDGKGNDYLAKALSIHKISANYFEIVIDEGKFHQVKRMFRALDTEVVNLKRIKVGNLELGELEVGSYREFEKGEIFDWNIIKCIRLFRWS